MKKVLLSMVVALGITGVANAQIGTVQLNAGVGTNSWKGVPVYVGVDYYVQDDISVGADVSYVSVKEFSGQKADFSIFSVAVNGNYHFDKILKLPAEWNVYAGLGLGYNKVSVGDENIQISGSQINLGGTAGARYFFTPQFAANLEFNGGSEVSGARIGITYRIK